MAALANATPVRSSQIQIAVASFGGEGYGATTSSRRKTCRTLRATMTVAERATFDATDGATRLAIDLGEQVRDAREAAGPSQRELATRMGTSQAAVARLEAGGVGATLYHYFKELPPPSASGSRSTSPPPADYSARQLQDRCSQDHPRHIPCPESTAPAGICR